MKFHEISWNFMKFHVWLKTVDRRSWLRPEGLLDPTASLRPECKVGTRTLLNDEVPSTHLRVSRHPPPPPTSLSRGLGTTQNNCGRKLNKQSRINRTVQQSGLGKGKTKSTPSRKKNAHVQWSCPPHAHITRIFNRQLRSTLSYAVLFRRNQLKRT